MTIWKFKIDMTFGDTEMPITHRVLSVGEQDGEIMVWALVDPRAPVKKKTFSLVGTGWMGHWMDGAPEKRFVGTVQMRDGLVWHVFE